MRVLTGVDGSARSSAAVQFIGRLLSADQDEIRLYYSPPPVSVGNTADPSSIAAQLHDYPTGTVFDKAREHLPLPLPRTTKSITGSRDPTQGLLVAADECRTDLLVVGARGLRPAESST